VTNLLGALLHPGHGDTDPNSWAHYLFEPVHLGALLVVLALAIGIGAARRRSRRSKREEN
jgi:hypothetical protein